MDVGESLRHRQVDASSVLNLFICLICVSGGLSERKAELGGICMYQPHPSPVTEPRWKHVRMKTDEDSTYCFELLTGTQFPDCVGKP